MSGAVSSGQTERVARRSVELHPASVCSGKAVSWYRTPRTVVHRGACAALPEVLPMYVTTSM